MREFLSTGGAARLLGLSRERVKQFVDDGRLTVSARDSNGHLLLQREVVERFRRRREESGAARQSEERAP